MKRTTLSFTESGKHFPPAPKDVLLAEAVLRYDAAILSCANDPEKMASFCSAEGDDLDALYLEMVGAARALLAARLQGPSLSDINSDGK